ncbi:MAG: SMP-30/gluconolactonase/LRE family protein [Gemmatimonadales bacterium]
MRTIVALSLLVLTLPACDKPKAAPPPPRPQAPELSILTSIGDTASTIEGIAQFAGQLYVCDWKDGTIYRIDPANPVPTAVGTLPTTPGTAVLGITADADGNLYFAVPDPGVVYRVAASRLGAGDFDARKDATLFATGATGANAMAIDTPGGHLWITGGPTGNLYYVGMQGGAVSTAATGYTAMSADTTMPVRGYLVNGIAINSQGVIYTGNTGTGEISMLVVGADMTPQSITTLVKDDRLIGADGLSVDGDDNIWVTANFQNTLARVSPRGEVTIVATSTPTDGANVLRFPAEFTRVGNTIYLANLNFPIGANTGQPVKGGSVAAVTLP